MLIDLSHMEALIADVKARTGNMTDEMRKSALGDAFSDDFDRKVAKCADYKIGGSILRSGGYFNVLGLGNWLYIAHGAGVEAIPARFISAASAMDLFAVCMGHEGECTARLKSFDADLSQIKDGEMLRFDACAFSGLKASLSEGNPKIGDAQKGWARRDDGTVDYHICERLTDSFLNSPEPHMVAWARPIFTPSLRQGWSAVTGAPGKWPKEWRAYVEGGEVVGISNYYLQSSADESDLPIVEEVATETKKVIAALKEAGAYPHHPRYEGARDTENQSFSIDWMELDSGDLVMVEAGPAHLTSPNWGAHPCCFDHRVGVHGLAMAMGDVRTLPSGVNGGEE